MNLELLLSPFHYKSLDLKNRVVMAPMTRVRVGSEGIPSAINAEYYAQRASAGLIISEATNISPQAKGFAFTPGIFNQDQIEGWRQVTDAVHAAGGLIFSQLWHVGRISHPSLQPDGMLPVAPSAVKADAQVFTDKGFEACVTPRALELSEISDIIEHYRNAANNAKIAGFDGVEIIAGGGYLIDQFLKDKTNLRTDDYGGSIPKRVRFMTEVVEAVVSVWSSERVGIRLSPGNPVNDISDSNRQSLFDYIVEQLNRYNLGYIHIVEGEEIGTRTMDNGFDLRKLRKSFNGLYMANNSYDLEGALKKREENSADLISFGRPFISNPDLVERFRAGAPLAEGDPSTFYGGDAHGYTDYPTFIGS